MTQLQLGLYSKSLLGRRWLYGAQGFHCFGNRTMMIPVSEFAALQKDIKQTAATIADNITLHTIAEGITDGLANVYLELCRLQ
ncbi:MAG: hypothetical protein CMM01_26095 [Rhodopirellula sp.]|nr:hypothetical protein [Rhodopirellula sp.]